VELKPGDRVVVPLASAHRDEDVYPDADKIVIDRKIEKSMVFGAGSHRCVGSHLARMELTIAFEELLRRVPRFSLQPGAELIAYGGQTRSLSTLPFRTFRD
jgi:cytochrome P450